MRRLVSDKSLAQHLDRNLPINKQVRRTIYRTHTAAAQALVETILVVEYLANQAIDRNVCERRVGLQRHVVDCARASSGYCRHILGTGA